jgi:hypothetical protein
LLTKQHLDLLYRVYRDELIGTPTLGQMVWDQLGFPNPQSASNAIMRGFVVLGYEIRARAGGGKRSSVEGRRRLGFGGRTHVGRAMSAEDVDELWRLYQSGMSSHAIAREHYERYGYESSEKFRAAYEYAWKVQGLKLRSNREAELLSRSQMPRRCTSMTTGAAGCRPRACTQRPLDDSEFCLHHDPRNAAAVRSRADAMRERKPLLPALAWADLLPHLAPLLVPRVDRRHGPREGPSGALARHTGIDASICSAYLKGKKPVITVRYANRMLAPLGVTVESLEIPVDGERSWKRAA